MNFLMYLKRLKAFLSIFRRDSPKISLLIPFNATDPQRKKVFKWVKKYWKSEIPGVEIIIGQSSLSPFCKTNALNNAVKKSSGKVLVIMDADAYIEGAVISNCADRILEDLENNLWYVPYRNLYRLTQSVTEELLNSAPWNPLPLPSPPLPYMVENLGHSSKYGNRYGAMCMMFPREAYNILGGFDERFVGWGGEDVAILRALDTLFGKHKTTDNDIFHMWHPVIGSNYKSRKWEGQETANNNSQLANKYHKATRNPSQMRALVDEGNKYKI